MTSAPPVATVVVDASVLVSALSGSGPDFEPAWQALLGQSLWAPDLIILEVLSVWRRQVRNGSLRAADAAQRLDLLAGLPLRLVGPRTLVTGCWQHRENLTVYDAAYVVLAETLDVSLVTADVRLARAAGVRCGVQLVT